TKKNTGFLFTVAVGFLVSFIFRFVLPVSRRRYKTDLFARPEVLHDRRLALFWSRRHPNHPDPGSIAGTRCRITFLCFAGTRGALPVIKRSVVFQPLLLRMVLQPPTAGDSALVRLVLVANGALDSQSLYPHLQSFVCIAWSCSF